MAIVPPRIESFFYTRLPGVRSIQLSENGADFFTFTLTAQIEVVTDALATWTSQANASGDLTGTYSFTWDDTTSQVTFARTVGGNFWLVLDGSLPVALGFTAASHSGAASYSSDKQPLAICNPISIDRSGITSLEDVEEVRRRWGRTAMWAHTMAAMMRVEVFMTSAMADAVLDGPLLNATSRYHVTDAGVAYGLTSFGGYSDLHVFRVADVRTVGVADGQTIVPLEATEVDGSPAIHEDPWSTLATGLPYGFRIMYAAQVEGIQFVFAEQAIGAVNPTGYVIDPSLIVDDSARIGSIVDRRSGIGKAFDLSVNLERNSITTALFKRPSRIARLTADLDFGDTGASVESADTWPSSGLIFIGRESIGYAFKTGSPPTTFGGLTRGSPNGDWRAYDHLITSAISTWVTDSPLFWRGRTLKLYAVPVDPYGASQSADFLADAVIVWQGNIQRTPEPTAEGWTLECRSLERRLERPIGAAVSGVATLDLGEPDPLVVVDPSLSFRIEILYDWTAPATAVSFDIRPFQGRSAGDKVRLSTLRQDVLDEWDAVVATLSDPHIGDAGWVDLPNYHVAGEAFTATWQLVYAGNAVAYSAIQLGSVRATVSLTAGQSSQFLTQFGGEFSSLTTGVIIPPPPPGPGASDPVEISAPLVCRGSHGLDMLTIAVDDGDPNLLPAAGWIIVEGGDRTAVLEYDDLDVLGDQVSLQIVTNTGPSLKVWASELATAGIKKLSVVFAFRDAGPLEDMMLRMLLSSGRGDNDGTYDTLPLGQGYDIAEVDTAKFTEILDGLWSTLSGSVVIDDEVSFVDLYGGLLALSQRAIVPVEGAGEIKLRPVRTSPADTADTAVTIQDRHLVFAGSGTSPVTAQRPVRGPNSVSIALKDVRGEDAGSLKFNDVVARAAEGPELMSVDTYGVPRNLLVQPTRVWSQAMFLDRHESYPYELAVVPWLPVQVGDAVDIDISHFNLWDKATGKRGYTGPARILGRQIIPKTGLMKLTILTAGTYRAITLSPSAPIESFSGAPGIGDVIRIPTPFRRLFAAYLVSSNPFEVLVYKPGSDGVGEGYTINLVTETGGFVELRIASVIGAPTLTTDFRVTLPSTAASNAAQDKHMHTDTDAVWR